MLAFARNKQGVHLSPGQIKRARGLRVASWRAYYAAKSFRLAALCWRLEKAFSRPSGAGGGSRGEMIGGIMRQPPEVAPARASASAIATATSSQDEVARIAVSPEGASLR